MRTLVIWITRHGMLPAEKRELQRLLGDFKLVIRKGKVSSAEDLLQEIKSLMKGFDRTVVVPILPLTITMKLKELIDRENLPLEIWRPHMEEKKSGVLEDQGREVMVRQSGGRTVVFRFKGFKRLRAIKIEEEDIEPEVA